MSASDARRALLLAQLEADWGIVDQQVARLDSVDPHASDGDRAIAAIALHRAYEAFESSILRVDRGLGLPDPVGPDSHEQTIARAALEIPGVRTSFFPQAALRGWHRLRAFRHFFRHAYGVELDAVELADTAAALRDAWTATQPRLEALRRTLA